MKVLWVTNILLPEFAERLGLEKINQGGWLQSLVIAIRKYAPEIELHVCSAGPKNRREHIDGVSYYSLGKEYSGHLIHRLSNKFTREISRLLSEIKPCLIHFHGSEGLFGCVPREVYAGYKCIVSLQGILQGCYPHYAGGINEIEIRRYRNYANFLLTRYTVTRGAESWRVRRGERERQSLSHAKFILGRTEWDKAWAQYLAPQARYFHVGEILRNEFYTGMRDVREVHRHSIFCGGAMTYPLKGAHWLLHTIAKLKHRYPDIQLRIASATKVKPQGTIRSWLQRNEYHRYLWQLIKSNALEDNVIMLPSLTALQEADELRKAEVFCLPSLCENSPNSIGEAMMLGVPIVATSVGGISSIITDKIDGLLVPAADPASLLTAITDVFQDQASAVERANRAYQTATHRYAPQTVVQQLRYAYTTILNT